MTTALAARTTGAVNGLETYRECITVKDPDEISATLLKPFDASLIENKDGQRFIGHEHIRMRLIEATGNCFDFSIDGVEYRDDGAIRERQDKRTGEVHTPLTCRVQGTLTIPGLGSRSDVGVQVIQHGSGEDSAYKGAVSDCLKRCAMGFGVGLQQLYMGTTTAPAENAPQRVPRRDQGRSVLPKDIPGAELPRMNLEHLRTAFGAALLKKNGPELQLLMDNAGDDEVRWTALALATTTESQLDWLIKSMDLRKVVPLDEFNSAVAAHRQTIKEPAHASA